jgi:hypothetical protein
VEIDEWSGVDWVGLGWPRLLIASPTMNWISEEVIEK